VIATIREASQHQAPKRFRSVPFFPTRRAHHGEEENRLQSHHRHPELRFFNTLCLPACNRCASLLHLHSKTHHHTSTLHRKRLTEDTKNKRFKHKKKPAIIQTTNRPRRSTSRNAILHLTSPPQARNRPWKPPLLKKQTNTKQAQIEFKITPTKKEETRRK
jgi:hypothetical protein